jgi:hypothetical protein
MFGRHGVIAPLLLATFILGACGAGADASPSATPSEGPIEWTTFVSDRYGYAIDHPSDWRVVEQFGVPPIISMVRPFDEGADFIASDDAHRFKSRHGLQVVAVEAEAGQTLAEFTQSVHMPCGGPNAEQAMTLAGEEAVYRTFRCNSNRPVYIQVTALHEGRGYLLWLMTSFPPNADERPEYQAMIESFEFTDAGVARWRR